MGPVVALIGLELAGSAAETGCIIGSGVTRGTVITFLVTLAVAVFGSVLFRGFFSTIPILIAIICGYIAGVLTGVIKTQTIIDALHTSFISIPNFQTPKFDINAILIILPVLLVIANEHIGHQLVTGKVIGRDLLKDPGLHRSLFADNFSTMISGFIGSVPTTTYGENIGCLLYTSRSNSVSITESAICVIFSTSCSRAHASADEIKAPFARVSLARNCPSSSTAALIVVVPMSMPNVFMLGPSVRLMVLSAV